MGLWGGGGPLASFSASPRGTARAVLSVHRPTLTLPTRHSHSPARSFIYIDFWQPFWETAYLTGYIFLFWIPFAVVIIIYSEYVKRKVREEHGVGWWSRYVAW